MNGSSVDGKASLNGGNHARNPLWIVGTRYSIGYSHPGHIASGCICKPLDWWLENVERCAEHERYTVEQQREYRMHVEHIAAWMRLYGVNKPETAPQEEQVAGEGTP